MKKMNETAKKVAEHIKNHKKTYIIVGSVLVAIILGIVIKNVIQSSIEENRDYYIQTGNDYTFDCNAYYDEKLKTLYCEQREIIGSFSVFPNSRIDTLYFSSIKSDDAGNFTAIIHDSLYKSDYETDKFDIDKIIKKLENQQKELRIRNTYLQKDFAQHTVTIHYNFSEADKALIEQKHNDWKAWKEAEDAKKAEQEANAQTQAEAKAKAKEEAQAQEKQAEQKTASRLSDSIAEQECQDAKYYTQSSYYNSNVKDIISISNYNFGVYEDAYDKDGNRILMVRWNGKDKSKNIITFVCYISGSDKDNLTVHWISGNDVDIWKSEADLMYNTYDENGNKLQ